MLFRSKKLISGPEYNEWDDPPIHHDAIPDDPNTPDVDESQPAWEEPGAHHKEEIPGSAVYQDVWVVDVPEHYEYEPGWRDGDFKYKGD